MRRITTAVVVLLAALVIAILAVSAAPGAGRPLYMNSHAGISARVNDLLHRMTLEEKVGQMDQQLVDNLTGPSAACGSQGWAQLNESCMKTWLVDNQTVARCSRAARTTRRTRPDRAAPATPASTGPTSTT